MKVPVYTAQINTGIFGPVTGYTDEVTYVRRTPNDFSHQGMPGHYPDEYSAPASMLPVMGEAQNLEGFGPHLVSRIYSDFPVDYGMSGYWNLSRLIEVQVPIWQQCYDMWVLYKEALESAGLEDTYITHRPLITPDSYNAELAITSWTSDIEYPSETSMMDLRPLTLGNKPNPDIVANQCVLEVRWPFGLTHYVATETTENVIAYYDGWEPELELNTFEDMPGNYMWYGTTPGKTLADYGITNPRLTNGKVIAEIQPEFFDPSVRTAYTYESTQHNFHTLHTVITEAELLASLTDEWTAIGFSSNPDNAISISRITGYTAPVIDLLVGPDTSSAGGSPTTYIHVMGHSEPFTPDVNWGFTDTDLNPFTPGNNDIYADIGRHYEDTVRLYFANNYVALTDTVSASIVTAIDTFERLSTARPKAWNHLDSEFVGYVPYHRELFSSLSDLAAMEAYARQPDNRFDGLYFFYRVKVSVVTRAWNAYLRNVSVGSTPNFGYKNGILTHTHWYDTETDALEYDGVNYCSEAPINMGTILSPGLLNGEYNSPYWEEYDWPSNDITIPDGKFLLESGSNAPIYPDFFGAYIYDLHLKKWGRMDVLHKYVFDYMSINTYKPGEQSFARFGVFGGIIDPNGKISTFNDSPEDSSVTYGKIGYYRQGMTSPEEVRVHMRTHSDFTIKITSSLEGKLIEPTFTRSTDFVQTMRGIHYGGYAAKWHNVTITGKYDITYLEFRGIKTGKR